MRAVVGRDRELDEIRSFLDLEEGVADGRSDVFRLWIRGVEQTTDGRLARGDVAVTS